MGSFAMNCSPMICFWQFSGAHEAFLQPFIAILMGFLQALRLLAEDPSSLDPICSASSAETSFIKVLFLASSSGCSCSPSDFGSLHPDVVGAALHLKSWLLFIFLPLPCYLLPRTLKA